jgi:hypothetical protein
VCVLEGVGVLWIAAFWDLRTAVPSSTERAGCASA